MDTIKGSSFTESEKNHAAFSILAVVFGKNDLDTALISGRGEMQCLRIIDELREGIPATKETMAEKLLGTLSYAKEVCDYNVRRAHNDPEQRATQRAAVRLTEMAVHGALRTLGFTQRGTARHAAADCASRG